MEKGPTQRYQFHDINEQWQADLTDISLLEHCIRVYRYIATVSDRSIIFMLHMCVIYGGTELCKVRKGIYN